MRLVLGLLVVSSLAASGVATSADTSGVSVFAVDNELLTGIDFAEIRNWVVSIVVVIGGFIALRHYIAAQSQRRLDNSFRLVAQIKPEVEEHIERWKSVLHGSLPERGAKPGQFILFRDGKTEEFSLDELFTEGAPDGEAITDLAQVFDMVCQQALNKAVDLRIIYYEYGQIMKSVHGWLHQVKAVGTLRKSLAQRYYPSLHKVFASRKIRRGWTAKGYVSLHAESPRMP